MPRLKKVVAKKKVSKVSTAIKSKLQKGKKKLVKKTLTVRKKKKVLALPKGYNNVTPYLIVKNAIQAIEFYKKVFGAKEVMRMERSAGKIMHAELKIGDSKIMLADECPDKGFHSPTSTGNSPISIHLYVKEVDTTIERAVAAGAKLKRPAENMFYGDRIGSLQDPFGHEWSVATHIEDVTPAKMRKRIAELFSGK